MSRVPVYHKDDASRLLVPRLLRWAWRNQVGWMIAAAVVLTVVFQFRQVEGDRAVKAQSILPRGRAAAEQAVLPKVDLPQHDVMALVNGQDITRPDLITACVQRHGKEVLESLVNKRLITNHC